VAFWAIMIATSTGQLGGILGGVSQSVSITFPITGDYRRRSRFRQKTKSKITRHGKTARSLHRNATRKRLHRIEEELAELGDRVQDSARSQRGWEDLVDANGGSLVDPWTLTIRSGLSSSGS
jgi:hypothetical protein